MVIFIVCIVVLLIVLFLIKLYNTSDFGDSVSPEEEEEVAKFHQEAFNERCRRRFIEENEAERKRLEEEREVHRHGY